MMKTLRRSALTGVVFSAAALLFVGGSAFAATVDVPSSANIIEAIEIDLYDDGDGLAFGDIVSGTEESIVTVDFDNSRSLDDGNAILVSSSYSAANIVVNGAPDHEYDLTVPQSVTLSDGAQNTMTAGLTDNSTGTIGQSGNEVFQIGGTLTVGADQPEGVYTGNFAVTVAYQ